MLNTCSIGRRWKSREGWSRPVLTGERGTLFPTLWWVGSRPVVVFSLDGKERCFLWSRRLVRCLICLRPLSGSRTATTGIGRVAGSVAGRSRLGVGRLEWFCGGHGPGETPGPFPNPEAKAWHGDGTALERVWESSAPPHSFVGGSRRASAPGTPFFCLLCRPADRSPLPRGFPSGLSRCSASGLFHAPGDLERRGISGISGEPLALIRWLNRLKNYALFRTQTLCRIEQNHVSRQSNSPAGRRPKLA